MAITVAQLETHLEAARGYAASGNWASVLTEVGAARAVLAGLPDGQDSGAQVRYSAAAGSLDMLEEQARRSLTAASGVGRSGGPVQRTKITWKRVSS